MKRLMILAAFPVVLSGCVLVTQLKLHSQDESVWRPALEELANATPPSDSSPAWDYVSCKFLDDSSYNIYDIAKSHAYRGEVRQAAIEMLANRHEYAALLTIYAHEARNYQWDPQLKESLIKAFDSDEGILVLMKGYCWRNRENAEILAALPNGLERGFVLAVKDAPDNSELAVYYYTQIKEPSLDVTKKILWNAELTSSEWKKVCESPMQEPRGSTSVAIADSRLSVGEVFETVLDRIPEKDLRECLPKMRSVNPDKYWDIWARCATNDEALKVWNSKASEWKRLKALGRIRDEGVLVNAIEAKDSSQEVILRAIGSLENLKKLTEYAQDDSLVANVRVAAFERLVRCVCSKPTDDGIALLTAALMNFDYTELFGDMFAFAQDEARKRDCKTVEKAVRDAVEGRVKGIIQDGKSVEEEVICGSGLRPGMYAWEFDLLSAYLKPSADGVMRGKVDPDGYVLEVTFSGESMKMLCGDVDVSNEAVVRDEMTSKYGNGLPWCSFQFLKDEYGDYRGVFRISCRAKDGIQRFKGRNPNKQEKALLQAEMIRKDGTVKGYLSSFFSGKVKPQKGLVYSSYNPWYGDSGENGEVMGVYKEGVVIGRKPLVEKTETKTIEKAGGTTSFLGPNDPKWVETVKVKTDVTEFPAKLFIKVKGNFVTGQACPKGKFRCVGEVEVGDEVMSAFEVYSLPKK